MKRFPLPSSTVAAIAALLAASSVAPLVHAQQAAPAKPAKANPMQDLLEAAEKAFFEGKYSDAIPKYEEAVKKYGDRMDDDAKGALAFRIASCRFLAKNWAAAEVSLKEFLEKFPNGTGKFLDENNNFRGAAQLSLAEAQANQKKFDEALAGLRAFTLNFDNKSEDKVKARLFMADLVERKASAGSPADQKEAVRTAIEIVKPVLQNSITIPEVREAAYKLVGLYTKAGMVPEATQLRKELEARITNPADLVRANFLKLDLGDRYFKQAEELLGSETSDDSAKRTALYRSAIAAYQGVHRRKYIEGFMEKAVAQGKERAEQARAQHPVSDKAPVHEAVVKAEEELKTLEKIADDFAKNKVYDALLAYRLGLCLNELKRPWEARIAFREVVDKSPDFEKADIAHYFVITCLNDIRRYKDAQEECKKFLVKYPKSTVLGTVAILLGDISMQQEEYKDAITNFRWARQNVKDLSQQDCENIDGSIADAYFRNLEWSDARKAIENFANNYPKSRNLEMMSYMRALTYFYEGRYQETRAGFEEYTKNYPTGRFLPDVRYRYALVILGLKPANDADAKKKAEEVITRCTSWLKDYTDAADPSTIAQRPEVINLKADAYNKIADLKSLTPDEKKRYTNLALESYIETAKNAGDNKQVLDFALRELNKTLPSRGEWDRLRSIYQGLYDRKPNSPEALSHLYWIIRATEKLGKTPEEKLKSAEEAKGILADAIVKNINDVRQENVESLIIELSGKLARETKRIEKLNKDKPGSAEPFDAPAAIERLLKLKENRDSLIAQARGYFAKAEIAKAMKNDEEANKNLNILARQFKPEELSPILLAMLGEHLLNAGKKDEAAKFFEYLKEHYRDSNFADYAFVGLAEINLAQGKAKKALEIATEAIDGGIAFTRDRDLRFVQARARLESGDFDGAKKDFTEIVGVKEWRGEVTAGSMFYLGLVEEKKGNLKEANNLYQRCYLAWRKYEKYAMKAIYRSAWIFAEKLGDKKAAIETLDRELFKNDNTKLVERYKTTPEWAEAEKLNAGLR